MATGSARVRELDPARVDTVAVENRSGKAVLALQGAEVLGARQNRMFNASYCVRPGATARIAVSCVEAGRWQEGQTAFREPEHTVALAVRARAITRVSRTMVELEARAATPAAPNRTLVMCGRDLRAASPYDAHQRQVWADVADHLRTTRVSSASQAHADAVAARRHEIDRLIADEAPSSRQRGIAALDDGRLAILDLLATPELYARAWPLIGRGLFASVSTRPGARDPRTVVGAALARLRAMMPRVRVDPDCGVTFHAVAPDLAAGAVGDSTQIWHLAASGAMATHPVSRGSVR
jgi:hypothetical protein